MRLSRAYFEKLALKYDKIMALKPKNRVQPPILINRPEISSRNFIKFHL